MNKINLIGPVDKRPLAYPLLKALTLIGKCMIITDDSNFRRFSEDYSRKFNMGNSDFKVVNDVKEYLDNDYKTELANHDFVLIITTNVLIEDSDEVIYCHGVEKSLLTNETLDVLESIDNYKEVFITQNKVRRKDAKRLYVNKSAIGYVWECEEYKMFTPCKERDATSIITDFFSEMLDMKSREISEALRRKVV